MSLSLSHPFFKSRIKTHHDKPRAARSGLVRVSSWRTAATAVLERWEWRFGTEISRIGVPPVTAGPRWAWVPLSPLKRTVFFRPGAARRRACVAHRQVRTVGNPTDVIRRRASYKMSASDGLALATQAEPSHAIIRQSTRFTLRERLRSTARLPPYWHPPPPPTSPDPRCITMQIQKHTRPLGLRAAATLLTNAHARYYRHHCETVL